MIKLRKQTDNNNFGDILTQWILKKVGIETKICNDNEQPNFFGVGSLLQDCPDDFEYDIWSTGFIFPVKYLRLSKPPLAVRGRLSLNQIQGVDKSSIVLGDGGLIIDKFYKPKVEKKYKLGIVPHYVDIDELRNAEILQSDQVMFIDICSGIENVINSMLSCEHIVTSSLHGIVICDSYNIPYALFKATQSNIAIHENQDAFKFKDYYSAFDMPFTGAFKVDTTTTMEECLQHCKPVNKPTLKTTKDKLLRKLVSLKFK